MNMKRFILLTLLFFSCSQLRETTVIDKHKFHSITHESVIYSHDNEPFDIVFKIQYQLFDTTLTVDSVNVMVLNSFELALERIINEHDKRDFFNENKRKHILDKMMNDLWDTEEQYLITDVSMSDLTESHQQ